MEPQSFQTFTDLLQARISLHPNKLAYHFFDGKSDTFVNYEQLDQNIRRYAAVLQEHGLFNQRVILIFPAGMEFMYAFYACMYTGAIAVPASEPRQQRVEQSDLKRLLAIIADSDPKAIVTTPEICRAMKTQLTDELSSKPLLWLTPTELEQGDGDQWRPQILSADHLCFLQYTSGSTGSPKGVMIDHRNLIVNQQMLAEGLKNDSDTVIVSWLPLFHDMGLITKMLHATYLGVPSHHTLPSTFIRQPFLWLKAISEYGGTFSGGPNFAYDLCVQRINERRKAELDLSSWRIAMNGSEPIREATQRAFTEAFAECGFNPKTFNPCYGLAEATVYVSGYPARAGYSVAMLDEAKLSQRLAQEAINDTLAVPIVGSGMLGDSSDICIVDPDTRQPCAPEQIGEIWVSGAHIGKGYWQRPELSASVFRAKIANSPASRDYLRTGDFGFIRNGELFFTGRLKELIICHGKNHYPQDIERTVEEAQSCLRPHCGAAFSINLDGEEKLVVAYEVLRKHKTMDFQPLFESVRKAILDHHQLATHAIVIMQPKSMPKTTSGKLQRTACRDRYLKNDLLVVAEWREPLTSLSPLSPSTQTEPQEARFLKRILEGLATTTHSPLETLHPEMPFSDFGLDSVRAISLMGMLGEAFGLDLSPTLIYDYPNAKKLAHHLAKAFKQTINPGKDQRVSEDSHCRTQPIAVVGMGCRFPGAPSLDAYWELLKSGRDPIQEIPKNRWDWEAFYQQQAGIAGTSRSKWGGFLEQVECFDNGFFGIAPREVEAMDPQQRLLLEVAWETLEDAAINPDHLAHSKTGVFLGISSSDFSRMNQPTGHAGTGNAFSIAANRLSYALNLRGPSMAIDTACSSSLVAIHQAVQALRQGECQAALAGGVNLLLHPEMYVVLSQAGMMSPTGRCHTFDASADGYVRGEGCGWVMLKPLSQALEDGNRIHAVIRGSAINQDGRSNGLTAPNGPAQETVIRQALKAAECAASDIDFVETHGSGTALGDPIEVNALKRVLGKDRTAGHALILGAVKSQIGHLEAAAGIAGFIKTALVLKHQTVPANLHCQTINPLLDLGQGALHIPKTCERFHSQRTLRFAGVSSFGFGGTNAHLVLETAPVTAPTNTHKQSSCVLLPISGKTPRALKAQVERFANHLQSIQAETLDATCFTAGFGRAHHSYRKSFVAEDLQAMREQVTNWLATESKESFTQTQGDPSSLVFLFTGQGSQYGEMAKQLYNHLAYFKQHLDEVARHMDSHLDRPLLPVLLSSQESADTIDQTAWAQPALFAFEYALAQTWRHWGVEPAALMGHSVGEYVAATLAGVFKLEDACKLIAHRAKLMQALPKLGGMAVCFTRPEPVEALLPQYPQLAIAAYNAPNQVVLSGSTESLKNALNHLNGQGIKFKRLTVSHAFHSPLMQPMLSSFEAIAHSIEYHLPQRPIIANLTGKIADKTIATPHYWIQHILQPVRFMQGLQACAKAGYDSFLEIGPKASLTGLAKTVLEASQPQCIASIRSPHQHLATMFQALGTLFELGQPIRWQALYPKQTPALISLPLYAWDLTRFPLPERKRLLSLGEKGNAWIGRKIAELAHLPGHAIFEVDFDLQRLPFLKQHRAFGQIAMPVAGFAHLALEGAKALGESQPCLSDLKIDAPLILDRNQTRRLQIAFMPENGRNWAVSILSQTENNWTRHATLRIQREAVTQSEDLQLGFMFFASSQDTGQVDRKYQLVLDAAKYADQQGFSSMWVPERHFTNLGCLYPNPAILQAALATVTSRIRLQAGSVVLPIHHPVRIAEEWSMVDNLSNGRIGLSCASGWNPDDFIFFPDRYQERRDILFQQLEKLRTLWNGGSIDQVNGIGETVSVSLQPTPIQKELPVWVTAAGNPKTFEMAGSLGAHLLTHLLDQGVENLAEKISIYRKAREKAGYDPKTGMVTVMLHTFIGEDANAIRDQVKPAYCGYLKNNIGLLRGLAHSRGSDVDITKLPPQDLDDFVEFLFDRFAAARGLIGSPQSCLTLMEDMAKIGVNEIACLLDIGPREDEILAHIPYINQLKQLYASTRSKRFELPIARTVDLETLKKEATRELTGTQFYKGFQPLPYQLEGPWQGLDHLWLNENSVLAQFVTPFQKPTSEQETPVLLEAATHAFMALLSTNKDPEMVVLPSLLPAGWDHFQQFQDIHHAVYVLAQKSKAKETEPSGTVRLLDKTGDLVAEIRGLQLKSIQAEEPQANKNHWLYELAWQATKETLKTPHRPLNLLVFSAPDQEESQTCQNLKELGHSVCQVVPGSNFSVIDAQQFEVNPLQPEAFEELWQHVLDQRAEAYDALIFLWPCEREIPEDFELSQLKNSQELIMGGGLHLLQTLAERKNQNLPELWLVTRGAQSVGNLLPPSLTQSPLWGLARVASFEYPELPLRLLDCDPSVQLPSQAPLLNQLLQATSNENQWALRRERFYNARLQSKHLATETPSKAIAKEGCYWVTGGWGGLGLALAQWLVDQGACHLILSGRSKPGEQANKQIEVWRALGVEIHLSSGDMANEAYVQGVFAKCGAQLPPLKGIFHLAGLPDTKMLFQQNWNHIQHVRAAKVEGSWLLHKHSKNSPLDHFVMFSSAAALLTLSGQSNYAAASTFMDMLAHYRHHHKLPGLSINWGPWGDVGHATLETMQKSYQRFDDLGMHRLTPAEGMDLMALIMADKSPQVGVIPVNWETFFNHDLHIGKAPVLASVFHKMGKTSNQPQAHSEFLNSLQTLTLKERLSQLKELVRAEVMRAMKLLEPPPGKQGFFDMGMDSLMALDLRSHLQHQMAMPLPSTLVFEHASIDAMAEYLANLVSQNVPARTNIKPTQMEEQITTETLDDLSDQDLAAMIDAELESLLP